MRLVDAVSAQALEGSRPADSLTVWAWRGDSLALAEPLDVVDWSFEDQSGDNVKVSQRVSLTVADPDGRLGAWRLDDPLSVTGTRLQIIYNVGGAGAVNYGWFRVTGNEPDEVVDWRHVAEYGLVEPDSLTPAHERLKPFVSAVVKLEAVDLTADVDRDRFEAPESPSSGATVLSETRRLLSPYFPVVVDPGVSDVGVSTQLVFERERLEACQDLLGRVSARYRMGGDGECHVYPRATSSVFRVGPNAGLVRVQRKQSIDGLYNRWVVEGKEEGSGNPVRAAVNIDSGPLRYGGPHGKFPTFYSSEMITSTAAAVLYAQELKAKFLASLALELSVECVPRPELQAGDRIEVGCPVAAGHVAYIPAEISSIRRAGTTVPGTTTLTVVCAYGDVIAALDRTEWAEHLTGELPPLTWDRMPATWGTGPSMPWDDLP
ncbi:hypothetical protein ACIPY0_20185 [Paenarthrobacter nicotinovorans]|uniref:hypothetical protein n=1 Tax=Paenarthrobacter nicotinovorans TaxID=29320 RepID=UPI0037FF622D